jgi:hypothetical protein
MTPMTNTLYRLKRFWLLEGDLVALLDGSAHMDDCLPEDAEIVRIVAAGVLFPGNSLLGEGYFEIVVRSASFPELEGVKSPLPAAARLEVQRVDGDD